MLPFAVRTKIRTTEEVETICKPERKDFRAVVTDPEMSLQNNS